MKKELISMWFGRIQRCEDLQNTKREERKQILKLYTGEFFGKPTAQSEMIDENFVYEYIQVLVSAIYARDPYIFVRTKNATLGQFAETMETVINDYWYTKNAKSKIKKAILDAVLQTPGFIEIGYFLLTEQSKAVKQLESEFPELKDIDNPQKTEEEQGILDETIKEDDVFLNHVSSWDILFPDGYHDIRECPYLIKRQIVTLDVLMANPGYKNKDKLRSGVTYKDHISPVTNYNMKALPRSGSLSGIDEELVKVTLYHVFDKMNRQRFTLAKGLNDDTLFEGEWDYLIDGHTIYPLIFNEIPKSDEESNAFGLSDIVPLLPQLKELSFITSAMLKHRKRAGTLLLAKKGNVTESDAAKIQNSSDVDMILLDDISETIVRGFTPPALPQDFYALRGLVLESLMRISGYNQLLGVAKGVQTATESENVRAGAVLRQSEKVDVIEDFTVNIAKGLAGLIWEFIQDKQKIADIIGNVPTEEQWPTLPQDKAEARKIIQSKLRFRIEAGATRPPKDEAIERKQWLDLIGIIKANFPNRLNDSIILPQLLKKFDFKDIERAVLGYDDQEIKVAQEENKLLMQGVPQLSSPNENDLLHLQVHSQIYQTPGMQATQQVDEHILNHKKNYDMKNPQVIPQKGDSKAAVQSTSPKQNRGGVTQMADLIGAVRGLPGTGGESGGNGGRV